MTKSQKQYQPQCIPDVLGLDTGQLFSQETEFHSFDTNQDDYIPY